MFKKLASVLLCLILAICVVPMGTFTITASAATSDEVTEGYYTYTVSNGEATITDCSVDISGDITIPATLGGCTVTTIGGRAFWNCSRLTNVTIPDSVTDIGNYTFDNCTSLTSVTIGNGVISISNSVFNGCTSLTSVTIGHSVSNIDDNAFYWCSKLTSINVDVNNKLYSSLDGVLFNKDKTTIICYPTGKEYASYSIPDSVISIGYMAFYGCTSLTNVTIPDSVTSIGNDAFAGCTSLTSVTIGNSVTSIGDWAFYYCTSLTSVIIPDSVTSIGKNAFYYCTSLTSVTIPDSVTNIGNWVFSECTSLTGVTIGNGVISIGSNAFYKCASLTSITIGNSVTSIGDRAFTDCDSLTSINVSANNKNYSSLDGVLFNKDKTTIIWYPAGKTNTSYTIPDSVTSIGSYAFYCCYSLASVTIPDSVTSIGSYAFYCCYSLASVTIPDSVTSIGSSAFGICLSLTSVIIPDSVTSIGFGAFTYCQNFVVSCYEYSCAHTYCEENSIEYILMDEQAEDYTYLETNGEVTITGYTGTDLEVVIPDKINGKPVTTIGSKAFHTNRKITSVTLPDTLKTIGSEAFRGCSSLTSVTFNEGLESIGTYAFGGTKLEKVVFPSTLKTIGVSAFNGVKTLTEIDLGSVQSIKGTAFANCTALGSTGAGNRVVIPASVTELGAGAFQNCTALVRVDWYPVKLASGAAGNKTTPSFMGCTGINEVRIYETAENIPTYAFYKASDVANNKGITTLRFMAGSKTKTIGDYAFYQQRIGKITFPNTITKIGVESFRNNNMLRTLTFGTGEQTIGQLAFSFCNNLPSVTIPGNVKTVYAYAFRGCSKLETVVVEEGVEYISSYAFGFTALKSITLPSSLTKINSGLTYPTNATINYPAGSYVDKYLHSSAARITGETLVPIA